MDDIIASGAQVYVTKKYLQDMFPNAEIKSIVLCNRPSEEDIVETYSDTEIIGINGFIDTLPEDFTDDTYVTVRLLMHVPQDSLMYSCQSC